MAIKTRIPCKHFCHKRLAARNRTDFYHDIPTSHLLKKRCVALALAWYIIPEVSRNFTNCHIFHDELLAVFKKLSHDSRRLLLCKNSYSTGKEYWYIYKYIFIKRHILVVLIYLVELLFLWLQTWLIFKYGLHHFSKKNFNQIALVEELRSLNCWAFCVWNILCFFFYILITVPRNLWTLDRHFNIVWRPYHRLPMLTFVCMGVNGIST